MSNYQAAQQKFDYLSVLLRAPEAMKNRRALLLLVGTLFMTAVVFGVGSLLAVKLLSAAEARLAASVIFMILAALVFLSGSSGSGLLLMDQAHDIELRGMMDAIIGGVMCAGKFLMVLLIDTLIFGLFICAGALLILVCKIPWVGPVLYTFIYPATILAYGLIIAMLVFVILPMTFPAIWEGNTLTGIYARRWSLCKERFVQIFMSQIVLFLIVALIAHVIFTALFSGLGVSSLLSFSILGPKIDVSSLQGFWQLIMGVSGGKGDGQGHMIAGALGGGTLFFTVGLIPGLIVLFGGNLIYIRAIKGLDFSAAEAGISAKVEATKRRAEEAKKRATEAAQRAREASAQHMQKSQGNQGGPKPTDAVQSQLAMQESGQLLCPGCGVGLLAEDVFCGECGHKLR